MTTPPITTSLFDLEPAQRGIALAMTEAELQANVLELARLRGWLIHHCRPALNRRGQWATPIQGDAGFCDLLLLRRVRVLAVELKSQRGRVTEGQQRWLAAFAAADCEVYIWRPADWLSGRVEAELR